MEVIYQAQQLGHTLDQLRAQGHTIGFVPTMGALHPGHLSLVAASKAQTSITVVSIFVNPTQFNDKADLEKYPRTPEADIQLLQTAACDLLYMPGVPDVYPDTPTPLPIDLGQLDKVMEGRFRPGHFDGVAQVVHRLFEIVKPHKAFFGEKDFQQLAIVSAMNEQMGCGVEIVPCPILREPDGLAMSSRNVRLRRDDRAVAPLIVQALYEARKLALIRKPRQVEEYVRTRFRDNAASLRLEYFEIVNRKTLQPATSWDEPHGVVACIAVWAGNVRLIDNLQF